MTSKSIEVRLPIDVLRRAREPVSNARLWKETEEVLAAAVSQGIDTVVVPVVWGKVEGERPAHSPEDYDWSYYEQLFTLIGRQELKLVPEFCFYQVGSDYDHDLWPLPEWLWGQLLEREDVGSLADLQFVSETGARCREGLSSWALELAWPYMAALLDNFFRHFAALVPQVPKLLISLGPANELRYPGFNHHDWGQFPNRGTVQCNGERPYRDFLAFLARRYDDEAQRQQLWQGAPSLSESSRFASFIGKVFVGDNYYRTRWGSDFCDWYHDALIGQGRRLLSGLAERADRSAFVGKPVGGRLPAIHWKVADAAQPRIAEVVGGVIAPHGRLDSRDGGEYAAMLADLVPGELRSRCVLHLNSAEQLNHEPSGGRAESLCQWLLDAAHGLGIKLVAENAFAESLGGHQAWDRLLSLLGRSTPVAGVVLNQLFALFGGQNEVASSRLPELLKLSEGQSPASRRMPRRPVRVMGPLHLKVGNKKQLLEERDWADFESQLRQLRQAGVNAVSIDIWWGLVEGHQQGVFDWDYYDRLVAMLAAQGLNWVPILSFHQAGGNVNDDYLQMVPLWLWGQLLADNPELQAVQDLQYVSETGDASMEYVSLWADRYVLSHYRRFMEAFREHYRDHVHLMDELNISMGPAGELRYPSYNAHDWGDYPNRGTLQCYSRLAHADFRQRFVDYYQSIEVLNDAWGAHYRAFDELHMPTADLLYRDGTYRDSAWARDFFGWYNDCLIGHGRRLLELALEVFSGNGYQRVPIGFKVPGIHWAISDPETPRAAEVSAGLIAPHPQLDASNHGEYEQMLAALVDESMRGRVVLHFTCLEMINKDYEGYSRAADLVKWVAQAADRLGINVMGENALAGELYGEQGWQQIEQALIGSPGYQGITLLRMNNFFSGHELPLRRLQELVNKLHRGPADTVSLAESMSLRR